MSEMILAQHGFGIVFFLILHLAFLKIRYSFPEGKFNFYYMSNLIFNICQRPEKINAHSNNSGVLGENGLTNSSYQN